ncbi:hypothetical protein [Parabacteroides sp. AM08-6]|uniref:hypothetical protein n=1 Tax=Parabacteroides sp. AM08-6 TaxID=2292053 RepID=UPI000EFEFD47|nr:hypothetical protein [Parabacteroides sp. AM08-6]RHJ85323.1 hypothetical protein DW103_03740 [Parabacteroides sp. AM08-6]
MNRRHYIVFILISIVSIVVYFPTFGNDFQYFWDDQWQVMNDYTSGGLGWQNLSDIFTRFDHGQYSPVNQLMYTLLYSAFAYLPAPYHCMSLLFHILNACLIYFIITKLLQKNRINENINVYVIAIATSLLFAIHPINVETVAWISASKIPTCTFFLLLGLYTYILYINSDRAKYFFLTILFFVLSFGCKEQVVIFPLNLLLIDWFLHRDLRSEQVWGEKILFFVLSICMGIVTMMAQGLSSGTSDYPFWQRLLLSCYAIFEYITKTLLPIHLNFFYPYPMRAGDSVPLRFWFFPFLLVAASCLVVIYRKNRLVVFALLLFLINLFLFLNIIPLGRDAMIADRYLYLSEVGLFLILSYLLNLLYLSWKSSKVKRYLFCSLVPIYLLYLGGYTYYYTSLWKESDITKQYMKGIIKEELEKAREKAAKVKALEEAGEVKTEDVAVDAETTMEEAKTAEE